LNRIPTSNHTLDHDLSPFLEELSKFSSSSELEKSELFSKLRPQIEHVLGTIVGGNFADGPAGHRPSVRATAWNIERGIEFEGILSILREHPVISASDVFLVTELDHGMARSHNRQVSHDLARELQLNYVFAPSYINLEKGSGLEAGTAGSNREGLHGNALFSRHPILAPHSIHLPNGKDKMAGKEKRLGSPAAIVATIDHPAGMFHAASVHLDAHSSQRHRMVQMRHVLDHLDLRKPRLPALIGGDWNTSTFDSRNAFLTIMGYFRRVLMGIRNVIQNHYPFPDRWFERHLFRELERRGFGYRDLNEPGGCTLHYDVEDLAANGRMADWIPNWCFWFINWALSRNSGRCSFKLDWFAGKGIKPMPGSPPRVIRDVHDRSEPLSDHDPIVLDFLPDQPS
jgi:endonuclease/exonuclease/phosphatase family metal-dependent hydrolase